jgi:AcrR family transcriptional regulator
MTRLSPKDRKASILNAAIRMALLHGYQKTTRLDIAIAADCSEALVSAYFGTMTQMRRAVVRHAIKIRKIPIIAQALAAEDPQAMKAPMELRIEAAARLTK